MAGELARRVGVAVVGIPVVLGALLLGGWVLGGLIALAAALGAREYYAMARARGERPFTLLGVSASVALVGLATVYPTASGLAAPAFATLLGLVLVTTAASVWMRWPGGQPMSAVASTVTGVLYVGATLAFVPILRALPATLADGAAESPLRATAFVALPLAAVWAGDSAAYFVGRAIGRRKLAPLASPGKTVEGALAGLLGSVAAGALVGVWLAPTLAVATGAWIGGAVGVAGQVGDLAESVLKREAGVKDSGRLLPGHGGMLDRLDALLFAFPATWALLWLSGALT